MSTFCGLLVCRVLLLCLHLQDCPLSALWRHGQCVGKKGCLGAVAMFFEAVASITTGSQAMAGPQRRDEAMHIH